MVERTIEEHKTRNGESFRANASKEIPSGGTLTLHLENPADSGKRIVITGMKVTAKNTMDINIPIGADVTSGAASTITTRAIGSNTTSVVNAYQDSTYTGADHVDTEYVGGGASITIGGQSVDTKHSILQGEDFLVEVSNPGSNPFDASITIDYYETSPA